jgi:hypothetical protein
VPPCRPAGQNLSIGIVGASISAGQGVVDSVSDNYCYRYGRPQGCNCEPAQGWLRSAGRTAWQQPAR